MPLIYFNARYQFHMCPLIRKSAIISFSIFSQLLIVFDHLFLNCFERVIRFFQVDLISSRLNKYLIRRRFICLRLSAWLHCRILDSYYALICVKVQQKAFQFFPFLLEVEMALISYLRPCFIITFLLAFLLEFSTF